MKDLHGHELINLIAKQEKELSIEEIKTLAKAEFGEKVVYHTCSMEGMNTEDLINFLIAAQKLVKKEDGYMINQANICNH